MEVRRMRTTIKQIAAALDVSAKTVSKALNDRGEVRGGTAAEDN